MKKRINKLVAIVAVVTIMATSIMTATVSAFAPRGFAVPMSFASKWKIDIGYNIKDTDAVFGLVQGVDTGITFRCTSYYNLGSSLYAIATFAEEYDFLSKYPGNYVELSYVGDDGTILFIDDWYKYNDGSVRYVVTGYGTVPGQYIYGDAL